jgi:catechol 2,3-dioxygenase-like lactoylglutathione lyase family enzyme
MITGLDHAHFFCGDVEKTAKYFSQVFEGKEISRNELRGFSVVRVDVKGTTLALMGTDPKEVQLEPGKGKRGLDHIGFRVREIESTVKSLQAKGAEVEIPVTTTPYGVKYAFIKGPDGIRIELVEKD